MTSPKGDSPYGITKYLLQKRASGLFPKPFFVTYLLAEPYFFLPFFEALRFMKKPAAQPTMPPKI